MDMGSLIGKMDQYTEGILKMDSERDKENILILKIQVQQEDFGKMAYSMEMGNIYNLQVKNLSVSGRIAR